VLPCLARFLEELGSDSDPLRLALRAPVSSAGGHYGDAISAASSRIQFFV
jgi:hypothetical protein